jgi:urease gamma subunit
MNGAVSTLGPIATLQRADTPKAWTLDARLRAFPAHRTRRSTSARRRRQQVTAPWWRPSARPGRRPLELPPEDSPVAVGAEGDARDAIAAAVVEAVQPSLAPSRQVLVDDYLPASTETIGSGGRAATGCTPRKCSGDLLPLDPREVHQLGVDMLSSINEERRVLAGELGYPDAAAAIAAHKASGANTATTAEQLVALAEDQVQRSWDLAPRYFGRLPSANCEVRRVEEFREADEPMAFYYPPTDDGTRAGIYYINCYDLADRALHHVASVTYHEANPGHHFQLALQQEMPERPPLRRFGATLAAAAFAEGWGLYSERLADGDGAVPRRLGTAWDAREPGSARRPARHRLGDPRARVDARTGGRHADRERADADRFGHRDRPLHRHAGAGAVLHDRDDRDPEGARVGVGPTRRRILPRLP